MTLVLQEDESVVYGIHADDRNGRATQPTVDIRPIPSSLAPVHITPESSTNSAFFEKFIQRQHSTSNLIEFFHRTHVDQCGVVPGTVYGVDNMKYHNSGNCHRRVVEFDIHERILTKYLEFINSMPDTLNNNPLLVFVKGFDPNEKDGNKLMKLRKVTTVTPADLIGPFVDSLMSEFPASTAPDSSHGLVFKLYELSDIGEPKFRLGDRTPAGKSDLGNQSGVMEYFPKHPKSKCWKELNILCGSIFCFDWAPKHHEINAPLIQYPRVQQYCHTLSTRVRIDFRSMNYALGATGAPTYKSLGSGFDVDQTWGLGKLLAFLALKIADNFQAHKIELYFPGASLAEPRNGCIDYRDNCAKTIFELLIAHPGSIPKCFVSARAKNWKWFPYNVDRPFVLYFLILPIPQQHLVRQGGLCKTIFVEKVNAVGEKISLAPTQLSGHVYPDDQCGSLIALRNEDTRDITVLKERIRGHLNVRSDSKVWFLANIRKRHKIVDIENTAEALMGFMRGSILHQFTFSLQYDGGRLPASTAGQVGVIPPPFRGKQFRGDHELMLPVVHFWRPKTISTPTLTGRPFVLRVHVNDKVRGFKNRLFEYIREHSQFSGARDAPNNGDPKLLDRDLQSNSGAIVPGAENNYRLCLLYKEDSEVVDRVLAYLEPKPSNGLSDFLNCWLEEFDPSLLDCNLIDVIIGSIERVPRAHPRQYFGQSLIERERRVKIGLERLNLNGKEYDSIVPRKPNKQELAGTRRWHDKGISIR